MTPSSPRTPIARAIVGALGILAKPALAGWILRALGLLLLGILPLAAISTYPALPAGRRLAFFASVGVSALGAGGVYGLGAWLGRRRR